MEQKVYETASRSAYKELRSAYKELRCTFSHTRLRATTGLRKQHPKMLVIGALIELNKRFIVLQIFISVYADGDRMICNQFFCDKHYSAIDDVSDEDVIDAVDVFLFWCGEGSQYPTIPLIIGKYTPASFPLCSMNIENSRVVDEIDTCAAKRYVS
jgi:hypothetical protein